VIQKQIPDFCFMVAQVGRDPDQRNYLISNDRIEATGFKTSISLDEGIEELIKGYQIIRRSQYSNA
jgi:nucleoside-diphosphate-sugar epimerase